MSDEYILDYGTHATPEDGRCAMEWVAHLAGEPHSDRPDCVSPVLRAICIALNDGLSDEPRQRLRPYLARTIGTAQDGHDVTRGWLALDWLIRAYAPVWLDLIGDPTAAEQLRALTPITDSASLRGAIAPLKSARLQGRATRRFAYRLPRATGWTSGVLAGMASRESAWGCTGAAAWSAARLVVDDSRADRARAAVQAIAADAAAVAVARHRAECGRAPIRELTRRALAPTLDMLTDSALGLLDRMLPTEYLPLPGPAAPRAGAAAG